MSVNSWRDNAEAIRTDVFECTKKDQRDKCAERKLTNTKSRGPGLRSNHTVINTYCTSMSINADSDFSRLGG